ncbi:MAG: alpha/beta hydrolase [Bdellovibrionota bacterium]
MKWIILRGLSREARHWRDFTDRLKVASEDVYALDLPGFGTEKERSCPMTIKGNTEDLRERWLEIKKANNANPDEEWGLLGISLGGMVALDWTHRYPYDFKRLVVINASSKDTGSNIQRFSLFAWFKSILALMKKDPYQAEKEVLMMVSNLKQNDEVILKEFAEIAKESKITLKKIASQLMASSQFVLPQSLKVPVLILASIKDHMVDVRCSKMMAERLKAQIKFHPTAGHDLTLDDPNWCVEKIYEVDTTTEKDEHGEQALPPRGSKANPVSSGRQNTH